MTKRNKYPEPETWHVLVIWLPLADIEYDLGDSLKIRRLIKPLTVFDLAAVGAVGFRKWAVLEPLAQAATAEIISPTSNVKLPGFDALNKCWLASALLVLRGFARHVCPAVSGYSWNFIAGHQKGQSEIFHKQVIEEGVQRAVYHPQNSLPPFQGDLLDYHLKVCLPPKSKTDPLDAFEADWISKHFDRFNSLAASDERFRFGLEAAIDWRYAKDARIAISRLWAGIESLLGIKSELVYRLSLYIATITAERGSNRIKAFKNGKRLYDLRSKAVHGGSIEEEKLWAGVFDSYEILKDILFDVVERGSVRSEEDYLNDFLG